MAIVTAMLVIWLRLVGETLLYSASNVNCYITE